MHHLEFIRIHEAFQKKYVGYLDWNLYKNLDMMIEIKLRVNIRIFEIRKKKKKTGRKRIFLTNVKLMECKTYGNSMKFSNNSNNSILIEYSNIKNNLKTNVHKPYLTKTRFLDVIQSQCSWIPVIRDSDSSKLNSKKCLHYLITQPIVCHHFHAISWFLCN